VTAGIVSARARDILGPYNDFIQIDAPVNQGNSGGPAFDVSGMASTVQYFRRQVARSASALSFQRKQ
jgi:S1-C subfamily serine protease